MSFTPLLGTGPKPSSMIPALVLGTVAGVAFALLSTTSPVTLHMGTSTTGLTQAQQITAHPPTQQLKNLVAEQQMLHPQQAEEVQTVELQPLSVTATPAFAWAALPLAFLAAVAAVMRGSSTKPTPEVAVRLDSVVLDGAVPPVAKAAPKTPNMADRALLTLQETAARARIEAEQKGFFNFFSEIQPGKAAAALAAAAPMLLPAAALANAGPVPTSITPDLIAGVAGGVSMVAFGQYLYDKAGGHGHGPPEAEHPIDPASQPFPEGEDGEALKAVFTEPYDIWRQSLLRYLGYSNELGEAFRPLVGDAIANSTYAVAVAYVLADSIDKAGRASERARELAAAAVFMQMDEGLHGQLKNEDLQAAGKSYKAPLSVAEMEEFLTRADVRKDNNIDFDEFYLALKRKDPALMKFLEAGAANLPEEQARPWRRAMVDGVNLAEIRSAVAGLDAMLWQLTASVAMPGFTINRVVALTGAICYGWKTALAGAVDPATLDLLNYIPTIIGLLSITVIVHPLDTLADELFNVSIRKYVFKKLPVDPMGQLTEADMIKKLNARGEGNPLPLDWMKRLFTDVDTDKDGFISLTEWRRNGIGAYNKYVASLKSPW